MLFNSHLFILIFLPVCFFLFYRFISFRFYILIFFSLLFYLINDPLYFLLFLFCIFFNVIFFNFVNNNRIFIFSIFFNLSILIYFKYLFIFQSINDSNLISISSVLPLGISFYTFNHIVFLFDYKNKLIRKPKANNLIFLISFFPHMIAGPFIRYSLIVNQIGKNNNLKTNSKYIFIGTFIFILGLAKKIILADNAAIYSDDFFTQVLNGHSPAFTYSWIHTSLFLFQLYFDFSAYSDMAIGLSLIFGIKLPINFDSPLKSTSIIEFWKRWHITLTKLIYEFIFIPLSLLLYKYFHINSLIKKIFFGKFFPFVATFLIVGLWHGGTLNFIIFGILNGFFIFINHQWRDYLEKKKCTFSNNFLLVFYWCLTFLSVVLCFVFFRSQNFYVANEVIKGMLGLNGFGLPRIIVENISFFNNFLISKFLGINTKYDSFHELIVIVACFLIIIFGKNLNSFSQEIDKKNFGNYTYYNIFYNYKKILVLALAVLFIILILNLNNVTNFIYFNF